MFSKRIVPVILILLFLSVVAWQLFEHQRYVAGGRKHLLNRAQDIANTLAVVIRSQRLFGGVVFEPRLESALFDLIQSEDLKSVVLFNANGEVVTSAGDVDITQFQNLTEAGLKWGKESVWVFNLVDLGIDPRWKGADPPTLILSEEDQEIMRQMRPRPPRNRDDDGRPRRGRDENARDESQNDEEERAREPRDSSREIADGTSEQQEDQETVSGGRSRSGPDSHRGRPPWLFRRPPGMDPEDYQALLQKVGLHGFIIEMSTQKFREQVRKDIWVRASIIGFAFFAFLGFALVWRNLMRTSDLQLRLVRANEMNMYLRKMNLAAAGLAHETRNPLNLVRGLAQFIARDEHTSGEVRNQATQISEEVDRVTAQLNEFINFSKPCEPKPRIVNLTSVIQDVKQTLISDIEDKNLDIHDQIPETNIEADEALLRQILFNLLLNAIQSVEEGGVIRLRSEEEKDHRLRFYIEDNGPGVPTENRGKIFQPYFTTREKGTGLGLAVVNQIVSAHGWDIKYNPSAEVGACFMISGIRRVNKG